MIDPPKPAVPTFTTRDPSSPQFWDERFDNRFMPWDQAGVPHAFLSFAEKHRASLQNVLIPGCGAAYEALWLAQNSRKVKAIDFSPSAVAVAREHLGEHAGVVEQADFFTFEPAFTPDWIYERAFLCALPPDRGPDYAARMAELLKPGGLLAGFYFIGVTPKGPPFGIERERLDELLTPYFEMVEEHEVSGSISVFSGRERWISWRRLG